MKIIHIAGKSNSGKTDFILDLIGRIQAKNPGKTGVIKHTGKHRHELEAGKDTTLHYEHGASYVAGIDDEKSFVTIKEAELPSVLDMFSDSGIRYAIVDGFKSHKFKKIILGDLEVENCILRNPSVQDVIDSLDDFDDHYTMQGLVKELKEEVDIPKTGCYLHFNGIVREFTGDERTEYMDFTDYEYIDRISAEIQKDMEKVPGVLGVRFFHSKGRLYAGDDVTYIAVAASHRQEAFKAMMDAIDRLKADLHNKK